MLMWCVTMPHFQESFCPLWIKSQFHFLNQNDLKWKSRLGLQCLITQHCVCSKGRGQLGNAVTNDSRPRPGRGGAAHWAYCSYCSSGESADTQGWDTPCISSSRGQHNLQNPRPSGNNNDNIQIIMMLTMMTQAQAGGCQAEPARAVCLSAPAVRPANKQPAPRTQRAHKHTSRNMNICPNKQFVYLLKICTSAKR